VSNAVVATADVTSGSASGFITPVTTGTFTVGSTGGGTATITVSAGDTLNDIIADINASGTGVTASLVNDPDGRANRLQITAASTVILGSAGDTSNFLSAVHLLESASGTTRTSVGNIGGTQVSSVLDSARFDTALTSTTSGKFKINGVAIEYDTTADTLNTVLSRINNSTAGVIATYDSLNDKVVLTNRSTGSTAITFEDVTGNLLSVLKIQSPASQTLGENAEVIISTIDTDGNGTPGEATDIVYSTSNTVSGIIPGVTLKLQSTSATPVTVTISQDVDTVKSNVKDFVNAFNEVTKKIAELTKYDPKTKERGVLLGNTSIQSIAVQVRIKLFDQVTGLTGDFKSVADVGISTGGVGAALGTTNEVQLDESKLEAALASNSVAVEQLLKGTDTVTGVMKRLEDYLKSLTDVSGVFTASRNSIDRQVRNLDDAIKRAEEQMEERRRFLVQQFTQLEQTLSQLQRQNAGILASLAQLGGQPSR